jgi:hypothetical protein
MTFRSLANSSRRNQNNRASRMRLVITGVPFCNGRFSLPWPTVLVCADAAAPNGWRTTVMALIEHLNADRVEVMMSRARAILVSLIPALLLGVSLDCFSDLLSSGGPDALYSLHAAGDRGQQHRPPADSSFAQAVQRWNRRLNAHPGSDGFGAPPALALSPSVLPDLTAARVALPLATLGLAQCWQFHWRTALEPRAPSLVS